MNSNRKVIVAGNWKMNKTASEVEPYIERLCEILPESNNCSIVLCAPYPLLPALAECTRNTPISPGAQNVSKHTPGAYTGEVSIPMLSDIGVRYIIVGHSERRQFFGETDEIVKQKTAAVLAGGMTPIICVGESGAQRDVGLTREIAAYQVISVLAGLAPESVKRCVIAYEPIWAIGTGRTATAEEAEEVARDIRAVIRESFSREAAECVRILYGGSIHADDAAELLSMPDIDGGLVGGASLDPDEFGRIVIVAMSKTGVLI